MVVDVCFVFFVVFFSFPSDNPLSEFRCLFPSLIYWNPTLQINLLMDFKNFDGFQESKNTYVDFNACFLVSVCCPPFSFVEITLSIQVLSSALGHITYHGLCFSSCGILAGTQQYIKKTGQ